MIRTGNDYIDLTRKMKLPVYYNGNKIEDVTTDPISAREVELIAGYHDFTDTRGLYSYNPVVEGQTRTSFLIPSCKEDLKQKRNVLDLTNEKYFGMRGRLSPYLDNWYSILHAHKKIFGSYNGTDYAENVKRLYTCVSTTGKFTTHGISPPQWDRSSPPAKWDDPFRQIGVVKEAKEGLYVSGCALLCTAPFAHELIYLPKIDQTTDPRHAIGFIIPTNTPGVEFHLRRSFSQKESVDYPVSQLADELDSVIIFKNVLVPWSDVIFYNPANPPANYRESIGLETWFHYQFVIQDMHKLKFLLALAAAAAHAISTDGYSSIQEKIGMIGRTYKIVEGMLVAAEDMPESSSEIYTPNNGFILAASHYCQEQLPMIYNQVIDICGSLAMPTASNCLDVNNPICKNLLYYLGTKTLSGIDRVKMGNLLWDSLCSEPANRQILFTMFARGPKAQTMNSFYKKLMSSQMHQDLDQTVKRFTSEERIHSGDLEYRV